MLQPLPIPVGIWEDISMNFITGFPKFDRVDYIFIVVDRLSKYAHFFPLRHSFTAQTIAQLFVKEVVKLHVVPLSIVSDLLFVNHFWTKLFRLMDTKLKMSSAYHLQTDEQSEIIKCSLEKYLRCFAYQRVG